MEKSRTRRQDLEVGTPTVKVTSEGSFDLKSSSTASTSACSTDFSKVITYLPSRSWTTCSTLLLSFLLARCWFKETPMVSALIRRLSEMDSMHVRREPPRTVWLRA